MDNYYIDIHSHLLFDIDDGSKTIEESIKILKQYEEMNFKDIVLTPHYIENSIYIHNNKLKIKKIEKLKEEIIKNNININIHTGNEVYITNNILKLLKKKEISCLNDSKYILIELPMNNEINNLDTIIFELLSNDIIPIIAHPERYTYIQKNIKIAEYLVNKGALLQINYGSIIGIYGNSAKKTVKKLLKNDLVTLIGTDIHHSNSKIYTNMNKIRKKIIKIIGTEKADKIMKENPNNIIYKNNV